MAAKDITPDKQSVESCLKQKTYYVDFYQREYVWKKETVEVLLQDIFYAFELSYNQYKDRELNSQTISLYNWYYLNVFITNEVDGKVYIVDGQQRLTTLTLIACKLYHITNNDKLKDPLKECIYAKDKYEGEIFCIDHDKRKDVMKSILFENEYTEPYKNATEENLIGRYKDISKFIDAKSMDEHMLDAFISYFLDRIVLVELSINKDDTPMVFEVINDRGEDLKPFEILKGKLIGMLDKSDAISYSIKWDNAMSNLQGKQDNFFRDYLKAKFVYRNNTTTENAINGLYHRFIFDDNDIAQKLAFRRTDPHHVDNVKKFINVELPYYAGLYTKILANPDRYLKYDNEINSFSTQYQNILAACTVKDSDEDAKISTIAKEFDRLWMLMTLNGIYESNEYQNYVYMLNERLVDVPVHEYRPIYDAILRDAICKKRNLQSTENSPIPLLDYTIFLRNKYDSMSTKLKRYFFARLEDYICKKTNQSIQNDVIYVSTRTGNKSGYHIEHILSNNEENLSYFDSQEEFDDKRNLIGGLLLLKGLDNISSGNENYIDKLKTYSNGFIFGHTLCKDFYHSNKDFEKFNQWLLSETGICFKAYEHFDKEALQERCKLVYELTKLVWEVK